MDTANPMVLTEDEAIELLAFLITAARIQVDEPADYGPLRLLTAAERLGSFILDRVTPETRQFLQASLKEILQTQMRMSDFEGYVARLDALCRAVAQHLIERTGLDRRSP